MPGRFFQPSGPTTFPNPKLLIWNDSVGADFGIDRASWSDPDLARVFSGASLGPGARPVAQAYSGHQFGQFNPGLGDGRAMLLGELPNRAGLVHDIHLKGSGATRFSRGGDGRANLEAAVREYLVSESLAGLGIPTSRVLAIILTGERVKREDIQPGAIVVRVARSHIRIGTFEHFAARNDREGLRLLADYVINRHDPDLSQDPFGYRELLKRVTERQAKLIAQWMQVGFIHGVMNTDNTFVSGETLDFGPCAFLDEYRPDAVFSRIDRSGRYAFARQPAIMRWNLENLAWCVGRICCEKPEELEVLAEEVGEAFDRSYEGYFERLMCAKIGITDPKQSDVSLLLDFLQQLSSAQLDFTKGFRSLGQEVDCLDSSLTGGHRDRYLSQLPGTFENWRRQWYLRLSELDLDSGAIQTQLRLTNPAYVARNHLVDQHIRRAVREENLEFAAPFLRALAHPFDENPEFFDFGRPAESAEKIPWTHCNT